MFRPNRLGLSHLRGDLFGGVTAAIIALPLALAFGVASGAGPVAGLWGAACVGLFASLFGGTPSQISGPTGPMTIVAASVFTQFAQQPAVAFTVVMMTGGFQILFGYLRLGRFVNLMPYPVISGFLTGVGCILIIMQLDPFLGYPGQPSVINALSVLPNDLAQPNVHALIIGLVAFGIVLLPANRLTRVVPSPLLALLVASLMVPLLPGAPVLAEVPSGLPELQIPAIDFAQFNDMLIAAAVLAALGSIDSLLTSLVADNMTRTFHDSDKELSGQGIGNLIAGVLGGIPGAGATIRTLANIQAGGRTALSGIVHAGLLVGIALGLGPLVTYIPYAALAGLLFKVGIDVIDWRFLRRLHRAPRTDAVLMVVVLILTVVVDVVTAVGVGVVIASLVFVKDMAEVQIAAIRTINDPENERLFDDATASLYRQHRDRLMFLHMSGPISFGAANELVRRFGKVGEYDVLIVDLLDVPKVDGSAALALEEVMQRACEAGRHVIVVGMTYPVARLLGRLGALSAVRDSERFDDRRSAVQAAVHWLQTPDEDRHGPGATDV
ncbi:SulP family inorganic anion transporter [Wenzhouxiangellaceae bacterium CH-27]|uniref:SulP family inorganic anion transporter n=2 Tax=Elongatibacter sediminis TaxID=3119006 RepID=A0AAW9R8X3_9GAMM